MWKVHVEIALQSVYAWKNFHRFMKDVIAIVTMKRKRLDNKDILFDVVVDYHVHVICLEMLQQIQT